VNRTTLIQRGLLGFGLVFVLAQLVPYGHAHTNPRTTAEPPWDSPQTRALVVRACFDCHSNQTIWPWYANLAPASWLLQHDVDEGRERLNFSTWDRPSRDAGEAADTVAEGEMPPWYYLPLHPNAALSPAEQQSLVQGLRNTLGSDGRGRERRGGDRGRR
jgi:mono/diheme cytochrome c family protein